MDRGTRRPDTALNGYQDVFAKLSKDNPASVEKVKFSYSMSHQKKSNKKVDPRRILFFLCSLLLLQKNIGIHSTGITFFLVSDLQHYTREGILEAIFPWWVLSEDTILKNGCGKKNTD